MDQFPYNTKVKIIGNHDLAGENAVVVGNGPKWDPLLWRQDRIWIRLDSGAKAGTHILVTHNQIQRVQHA